MPTTKTLALAALTALSLGMGTAMAQDGGTTTDTYWQQQLQHQPSTRPSANGPVFHSNFVDTTTTSTTKAPFGLGSAPAGFDGTVDAGGDIGG